jgi:hypothetical protein
MTIEASQLNRESTPHRAIAINKITTTTIRVV